MGYGEDMDTDTDDMDVDDGDVYVYHNCRDFVNVDNESMEREKKFWRPVERTSAAWKIGRKTDGHFHADERKAAVTHAADAAMKNEAELQSLHGQIFDLTQPWFARTASRRQQYVTERLAGVCRTASEVESAKKALATALQHKDDMLRCVGNAVAWRYWSGIPAADRLLIRNKRAIDTAEVTQLKARHANGCAEYVRSKLASIGSSASSADLEVALVEQEALAPFRITPRQGHECPECKGKLVDRSRKSDGFDFLGCSNFPACRFAWSPVWGTTMSSDDVRDVMSRAEIELIDILIDQHDVRLAAALASDAGLKAPTRTVAGESPLAVQRAWSQLLRDMERHGLIQNFYQALLFETVIEYTPKFKHAWKAWERSREEEREAEAAVNRAADANVKNDVVTKTAACTAADVVGTTKDEVEVKAMSDTKNSDKGMIKNIVETMIDTTKEDGVDAAWRTAADEALEICKPIAR